MTPVDLTTINDDDLPDELLALLERADRLCRATADALAEDQSVETLIETIVDRRPELVRRLTPPLLSLAQELSDYVNQSEEARLFFGLVHLLLAQVYAETNDPESDAHFQVAWNILRDHLDNPNALVCARQYARSLLLKPPAQTSSENLGRRTAFPPGLCVPPARGLGVGGARISPRATVGIQHAWTGTRPGVAVSTAMGTRPRRRRFPARGETRSPGAPRTQFGSDRARSLHGSPKDAGSLRRRAGLVAVAGVAGPPGIPARGPAESGRTRFQKIAERQETITVQIDDAGWEVPRRRADRGLPSGDGRVPRRRNRGRTLSAAQVPAAHLPGRRGRRDVPSPRRARESCRRTRRDTCPGGNAHLHLRSCAAWASSRPSPRNTRGRPLCAVCSADDASWTLPRMRIAKTVWASFPP